MIAVTEGKGSVSAEAVEELATFVVVDVTPFRPHFDSESCEAHELSEVWVDVLRVLFVNVGVEGVGAHIVSIRAIEVWGFRYIMRS